jgi:SAM-dependent methyltransferase
VLGEGGAAALTKTSERRTPGTSKRAGDLTQDLFHLFPYHFVAEASSSESRILEVGFGDGYGVEILAGSVGEYVGLEVSPDALALASANHGRSNVRFMLYDGTTLPFESESFDCIISFHVLEHLSRPESFLAEAARVCRSGGRIVIVTPNAGVRLEPGERPWNRFHVQEFTGDELQDLLSPRFSRVSVMGIAGNKAMNDLERSRVARARRIAKLDPLGCRYWLPEGLMLRVRRLLMRAAEPSQTAAAQPAFTLEDVRLLEGDLDEAIHLLAVGER